MAGMKQLSAGSSQILMMMFRDKNNAPIKADSVHVKGSIFTGSGKPFEFEVNKGVCTNCKIQNDMLLFNIVPLLGLGQMQVYTQTFLGDAKAITGTYISENQQKLGVEVVQKGTFLSDRQGAMWVDVYLPIEINDAAQIPWVPAGADEQWIKDYLDKYVKTPAFAATLAALGGASKNLSNVDAKDFEKKAKDGNFAQNDLADVDLAKLKEKGLAAGLADAKNPISPTEFDRMIKQNAAFIALSKTAHPATAGKTNEQLVVKDNGKDLPVFSLFKKYSRFDTHVLKGKNYKATVKITDKQNSFVVALMKYTGTEAVAPSPELLSINNDQPQFNAGWSIADRLFISEDVVSGIHEATKTFVVPADAVEFAVIIYPTESQTPTDMVLNDFEGDITPWFNRMVVTDSSHISEKYLEYQKDYAKFVVMTPAGDASYRYTYNKTAGNIPLGIKKGLALVSNNNAWADPGASDPNKVQGDLLAEADGIITIQYSGQAYNETSTMNEANFWAVKVAPDGSLTEVPNSRYSTTIEANRKIAKNIQSKSISFPIQQGESVRFLANSNIDDGFYLQSGTDGKPLFEVIVNFKEMVGMPFIPDELEKGATEFYE